MTGNSRYILLLGASLLVVAFAGMSTVSGDGWVIPMATLLSGILLILVFSFITIKQESEREVHHCQRIKIPREKRGQRG